jgi:hypothetical protein
LRHEGFVYTYMYITFFFTFSSFMTAFFSVLCTYIFFFFYFGSVSCSSNFLFAFFLFLSLVIWNIPHPACFVCFKIWFFICYLNFEPSVQNTSAIADIRINVVTAPFYVKSSTFMLWRFIFQVSSKLQEIVSLIVRKALCSVLVQFKSCTLVLYWESMCKFRTLDHSLSSYSHC